jgi:hypothetical protein
MAGLDDEMTISVDERKAAIERVLVRLAEMFWDALFNSLADEGWTTSPISLVLNWRPPVAK